ncbi:MAG: phosphorylase [Hyphomicrobiales bacterium]|nr:phosphorylase [Hyphomicrobiales bacterium]
MERTLLVVTGLTREARAAAGPGITTLCSGGDSRRLERMLARTAPQRHLGVVSFGIAGGLRPDLEPGDLVLGESVVHNDESFAACGNLTATLRETLSQRDLRVIEGPMAGVNEVVATPRCKARLHRESGAIAVDMESHVAARWAASHGLPFSIVRVVSDPAHRTLPAVAANALKPDGGVDVLRVLRGLAKAPRQLGALAKAGVDARAAFAALGRCGVVFAGI